MCKVGRLLQALSLLCLVAWRQTLAVEITKAVIQGNAWLEGQEQCNDTRVEDRRKSIAIKCIGSFAGPTCSYVFDTEKCYDAKTERPSWFVICHKCGLKGINEWNHVCKHLYKRFRISYREEGGNLTFTVLPCSDEEVTKRLEIGLASFLQPNITKNATSLLDDLNKFQDSIFGFASSRAEEDEVGNLSVPGVAEIEYGKVASGPHNFPEKPDSTQLLAFNSSIGDVITRKKRAIKLVVFVFTKYFFNLDKMIPFYSLSPSASTSFWQTGNITKYQPSATVPYLSVNVFFPPDGEIDASVSFAVDMRDDTTVESVGIPSLFKIYRSWFELVEHDFVCQRLDVNLTFFTSDGCTSKSVNGVVTCSCDRTGMFTVVPRIVARVRPEGISTILSLFLVLGLVFLLVTILALVVMKSRVTTERVVAQINLVTSLFFLHVIILVESRGSQVKLSCEATTFFTHYFILTTACFALMESFTILITMTTRSLRFVKLNRFRFIAPCLVAGWGIPLLIAVTVAGSSISSGNYVQSRYGLGYERCWMRHGLTPLLAGVIVPIATVFAGCFATFAVSMVMVRRAVNGAPPDGEVPPPATVYDEITVDDVDLSHVMRMLVENVTVCLVLMTAWTLYFMPGIHNLDVTQARLYVTMVAIGLHGVIVFIVYVILSRDVRTALCWKEANYPERYDLYWYGPYMQNDSLISMENPTVAL